MIRGALDLTSKQALVGMTPMEKVRAGACKFLHIVMTASGGNNLLRAGACSWVSCLSLPCRQRGDAHTASYVTGHLCYLVAWIPCCLGCQSGNQRDCTQATAS